MSPSLGELDIHIRHRAIRCFFDGGDTNCYTNGGLFHVN